MKKVTGKGKEVVDARGLRPYDRVVEGSGEVVSVRPEYVTMSRRGGIGESWFRKYAGDVYPHDYVVLRGGVKMPPPRYYDGKYELDNSLDMERIKLDRIRRCTKFEDVWNDRLQKFQRLDVNRDDRLVVMDEVKQAQLRVCRKKLESGL